jgi:hypothetical protein
MKRKINIPLLVYTYNKLTYNCSEKYKLKTFLMADKTRGPIFVYKNDSSDSYIYPVLAKCVLMK